MQTLSNVPFNELRVGDRVKSKITNIEGAISSLYMYEEPNKFSNDQVFIRWENGNFTFGWSAGYNNIWLM